MKCALGHTNGKRRGRAGECEFTLLRMDWNREDKREMQWEGERWGGEDC